MPDKNELLDQEIKRQIDKARQSVPEKDKDKKPLFYTIVIILVTIAVLYSLLRSFISF